MRTALWAVSAILGVAAGPHQPEPAGCTARAERGFSFSDRWTFSGRTLAPPWCITHAEAGDAGRIAISARHQQWWAGLVTVVDAAGRRSGTFVNGGWIDDVRWVSPTRLMIAGYSAVADAGMVALLDTARLDGQSPEDPGAFHCDMCGANAPIRYVILPRSEANRATKSPLNRARLEPISNGFIARTLEVPAAAGGEAIEVSYELSPTLEVRRVTFGDDYWNLRDTLMAQGRMAIERRPTPEVLTWDPQGGWLTLRLKGGS